MDEAQRAREREAFEAAMSKHFPIWGFGSDGCGGYHAYHTDAAWVAWQERAELALAAQPWVRLADSDWVNIVNAPSVLDPFKDKEEAVREAVRLTEDRFWALHASGVSKPDGEGF